MLNQHHLLYLDTSKDYLDEYRKGVECREIKVNSGEQPVRYLILYNFYDW